MKKILLSSTIGVFTVMAITAGVASARGEGGPRISFEQLDTDNSGGITEAEMTAHGMARFSEVDANGDGLLALSEIQAQMTERHANRDDDNAQRAEHRAEMSALRSEHRFERQDADGDGLLSFEEVQPKNADERFARLDADGNGEISEEEFEAAQGHRGKKRGRGHGNGGNG